MAKSLNHPYSSYLSTLLRKSRYRLPWYAIRIEYYNLYFMAAEKKRAETNQLLPIDFGLIQTKIKKNK